jgi:hypothetical protein
MARQPRSNQNQTTARAPRGRKPPPADESRHDKFLRIATRRMRMVLRQIQLLGNLSSSNYETNADEIKRMHEAIDREMDAAFGRLEKSRRAPVETFTLKPNNGDK